MTAPEFSHLIQDEDIESKPVKIEIEADDQERGNLAKRLDILELKSLKASLTAAREGGLIIHIYGSFEAKIVQNCVVSLEPIESTINEGFEAWYADHSKAVSFNKARREKEEGGKQELPMMEEKDDPEPIVGGVIDVGELVTQHLSLAIDPYPHATEYDGPKDDDPRINEPSPIRKNPFAALKALKKNKPH